MFRNCSIAIVTLALVGAPGLTKPFADGLFNHAVHDFGSVPRGPVLTHYYHVTNNTQSPIHIAGVRVSCGCVSASAMQNDLAPGQSTSILAQMDTRRFTGSKTVTIFVTFDRPRWEEARLTISAYGRDDMTLDADTMTFGSINRGSPAAAKMTVTLRQQHWAIQGATSDSNYVLPEFKELRRNGSETVYEVAAKLQPGLPVGRWTTELTLTTNSPVAPTIRVPATVEILPSLVISPGEVKFGAVVGSPSESKLLIRGGQPFRIKEIQGTDGILSADSPAGDAKAVHVITVKVDAKEVGELSRRLKIITDLPSEGTAEVAVKAQVTAPK